MHVSVLVTVSAENRITRVLPRGNTKSDFNTLPPLSRVTRIGKTGRTTLRTLILVDRPFQDTPTSSAVRPTDYRKLSRSLLHEAEQHP